jgi:hypothetical protein
MSSRIRGRRYRNVDPDERYGFTSGPPTIVALGPERQVESLVEPLVEVVSLDGTPLEGTTVTMDETSVTMDAGTAPIDAPTVALEPRTVIGPQRAEG